MIDPKFNELPVDAEGEISEREGVGGRTTPRPGLSINDTVAANANLSVGSRGVDTSGASVGSGAGAGMTMTTAAPEETAAPVIVPGARGSGTTLRGDTVADLGPTTRLVSDTESETGMERGPARDWENATLASETATTVPLASRLEAGTESWIEGIDEFRVDEISERAYHCWVNRGSPHGSPEVDWHTAVEQLRRERERAMGASV